MTPTQAREAAGLTVEQAAKLARITPAYLRRKEREGGFSFVVASRLERAYRCDPKVFLARSKSTSTREETRGKRNGNGNKGNLTNAVTACRDGERGRGSGAKIARPALRLVDFDREGRA